MEDDNGKRIKMFSLIGVAVLAVIVIGVLLISNMSVTKKDDSKAESTPTAVETTEPATESEGQSDAGGEGDATQTEEGIEEPSADSTETPTEDSTEKSKEESKDDSKEDFTPSKVKEPKLEGNYKAGGFVLDKYVLNDNKQYQYVVELRLTNDSGSRNIKYYATKKAYDGLNEGDVLTITYSGDPDGNLAVETISR